MQRRFSSGQVPNSRWYVKFIFSNGMMLDCFIGTDGMKFAKLELKMSNFLSAGNNGHAGDILEWITQDQDDVDEDRFDTVAMRRGCVGQARDHTRFARYLFTALSNRTGGTIGEKRTTRRRSERLKKTAHCNHCDSTKINASHPSNPHPSDPQHLAPSLEFFRAKTRSDASSAIQMLGNL